MTEQDDQTTAEEVEQLITDEQRKLGELVDWVMLRVTLIQVWQKHNRKCRRTLAMHDVDPIDPASFPVQRKLCRCGAVAAFITATTPPEPAPEVANDQAA